MKIQILSADNMATTIIDAGECGQVRLGGYVDIYQGLHDSKAALETFLQGVYDAGASGALQAKPEPVVEPEPVEDAAVPEVEEPKADAVADTEPAPEPVVKAKRWFGK